MNLVIDFGNTRIKAALFNKRELIETKIYDSVSQLISDKTFLSKSTKGIISSVVSLGAEITEALPSFLVFTSAVNIPIKNLYKTSATLGSDRLAAAIGAHSLYPSKNILVIDTGTCLKYNFISDKSEYLGGAISPGLQMRFKALNHYTDQLPLVEMNADYDMLIGQSTNDSILSGVINGVIAEVDGIINEYKKMYSDLTIVVSGGDTEFFAKRLKNRIFAHPHTVLIGLNEILIFNS